MPQFSQFLMDNQYRGDFVAVWSRDEVDNELYSRLKQNWMNPNRFKLSLLAPPLPRYGTELNNQMSNARKYSTFFRSDHASFWYPTKKDVSFNAVLLTDMSIEFN